MIEASEAEEKSTRVDVELLIDCTKNTHGGKTRCMYKGSKTERDFPYIRKSKRKKHYKEDMTNVKDGESGFITWDNYV